MSITARSVGWSAGGRQILRDVDLDVHDGATVGLLGPNGSGKSSLLRLLAGLRRPATGRVEIDGSDVTGLRRRDLARRVAVVEQESTTSEDVLVRDVIALGRIAHRPPWAPEAPGDHQVVEECAARTDVADRLDDLFRTLSGGERQRVQLARALAQEPTHLLLDEPTNHLDLSHQLGVLHLVRRLPSTHVIALHDLSLAGTYCDHVVVLDAGQVVAAGAPEHVITASLVREVWSVDATVETDDDGMHVRWGRLAGP